MMHFNRNF